jgi:hypothetical protein
MRQCSICGDPRLTQINASLFAGQSFSDMARRWDLNHMTLRRHKDRCLVPPQIVAHIEQRARIKREDTTALSLAETLTELHGDQKAAVLETRQILAQMKDAVAPDKEQLGRWIDRLAETSFKAARGIQGSAGLQIMAAVIQGSQEPPKMTYEVKYVASCPNCGCPECRGSTAILAS